jgi:hypothetical protein
MSLIGIIASSKFVPVAPSQVDYLVVAVVVQVVLELPLLFLLAQVLQ